jgi:glucokinase
MKIIAADIGGTTSRLVLSDLDAPYNFLFESNYSSKNFDGFSSLLKTFMDESGVDNKDTTILSMAMPGVVTPLQSTLTNLPWVVTADNINKSFNICNLVMLNDFQAAALGVRCLHKGDWIVLNKGGDGGGSLNPACVVAGAGTGLGVAWIQDDSQGTNVFSTEGGHIDFAPVNMEQIQLLEYMLDHGSHVSYERLLSGEGLVNIYKFLTDTSLSKYDSSITARWIQEQADLGENDLAFSTMRIFTQIYGAYVGNLALLFKPGKGLFIAGGIAPKISGWLETRYFRDAYLGKGRMRCLCEHTNVNLITDERVGIFGAIIAALPLKEDKSNVCH